MSDTRNQLICPLVHKSRTWKRYICGTHKSSRTPLVCMVEKNSSSAALIEFELFSSPLAYWAILSLTQKLFVYYQVGYFKYGSSVVKKNRQLWGSIDGLWRPYCIFRWKQQLRGATLWTAFEPVIYSLGPRSSMIVLGRVIFVYSAKNPSGEGVHSQ